MRFFIGYEGGITVDEKLDKSNCMRNYVFNGIIGAWRCKPEARKVTLGEVGFLTRYQERGLPGHYEVEEEDLPDLFALLKESGIGVLTTLSAEEKTESENEQKAIFKKLKALVKSMKK